VGITSRWLLGRRTITPAAVIEVVHSLEDGKPAGNATVREVQANA